MDASGFKKVEAQRLQLEENIAKLRKSLRHWQTLEIDYECLKEELIALPEKSSKEECLKAARDSGAKLVDEKELLMLFNNGGNLRKPRQVVDVLTKRIEYVSRNIDTIRKQVSDAEKRRNALLLAEDSEHRGEAGLPLTEITEELDENDNIISSRLQTAASTTPQLVDVLKKAGVSDIVDKAGTVTAATSKIRTYDSPQVPLTPSESGAVPKAKIMVTNTEKPPEGVPKSEQASKVVNQYQISGTETPESGSDSGVESAKAPHNESVIERHPDDTEEDVALRQEMLHYGLGEVGAIVAELDLEEQTSNNEDDTDSLLVGSDFDEDEDDDEEEEESEDERGMTKRPMISDVYRRRMEELSKKLGMQGLQNVGQSPDLPREVQQQLDRSTAAEAARKAALARADAVAFEQATNEQQKAVGTKGKPRKKEKKKVAFSNQLDIEPTTEAGIKDAPAYEANAERRRTTVRPIGDKIVERTIPKASQTSGPKPTPTGKRVSKFKAGRMAPTQESEFEDPVDGQIPKIPPGKLVADTLVERPPSKKHSRPQPPESNDIDEELHKRQIANEYYRIRNRVIQEQGGFVGDGEQDNYGDATAPLYFEDEDTGEVKRVSRFKAARMM